MLIESAVNRNKEKTRMPAVEQKLICPYRTEDIFQVHSPMKLWLQKHVKAGQTYDLWNRDFCKLKAI